ncbi:hypothetical protein Q5M85_12045 [Paraclostridium bifermentans]|nr:hypothetical protein [Paraclostridium bifermentans]
MNRGLYSAKLKSMQRIPIIENLFEKDVNIKRIDIFDINSYEIQKIFKNPWRR